MKSSLWKRSDTSFAQRKVLNSWNKIHNLQSFINMFIMQTRLPKERIAIFKPPFTITEADCFGPVTIKQYKQPRKSKNNQIRRNWFLFTHLTIHSSERWTWYYLVRQRFKLGRRWKRTKASSTLASPNIEWKFGG